MTHRGKGKTGFSISSCECSLQRLRPVWSWVGKLPLLFLLFWLLEVTEVSLSEVPCSPRRSAGADESRWPEAPLIIAHFQSVCISSEGHPAPAALSRRMEIKGWKWALSTWWGQYLRHGMLRVVRVWLGGGKGREDGVEVSGREV